MQKQGQRIIDNRLKFKKTYQRKFIQDAKYNSKLTWSQLANVLNVSEYTLRRMWGNEKATLPQKVADVLVNFYPNLSKEQLMSEYVLEIFEPNWGQKLNPKKQILIPEVSEILAEFVGIMLGDGHIGKKGIWIAKEYNMEEIYTKYINNLIYELFDIRGRIYRSYSDSNAQYLNVYSIDLVAFLNSIGLKTGNKIKNQAVIPKWLFKNKQFLRSCIRGLIDTDGGIYHKQKGYTRALIEFQTKNPSLRESVKNTLEQLSFTVSKSSGNLRIQNQSEIYHYFKEIGSSNPKHILRYKSLVNKNKIPYD